MLPTAKTGDGGRQLETRSRSSHGASFTFQRAVETGIFNWETKPYPDFLIIYSPPRPDKKKLFLESPWASLFLGHAWRLGVGSLGNCMAPAPANMTVCPQIHMKTMPAAMYRLLTAQEQPVYI